MQFGFLLMTKNVNAYGTTATTAYGIGNKINSIITMPANGIGSAISTIVGQNFGAGNIKRTDKSYHIALRIGAVFLFVMLHDFIQTFHCLSQSSASLLRTMQLSRLPRISYPLWQSAAGQTHFIT